MNVNPLQLIAMIRNGSNPQQLVMNILQNQMSNTPMGQNLIELAKANDYKGIENVARNICKQQGRDFDTEFRAFKQNLGL